jgi:regulator of protease activity HflC (stomatin/prohibitin superfamily)
MYNGNNSNREDAVANLPIFKIVGGLIGLVLAVVVFFNVFGITRIEAGHVGVEVNLAGSQRGALDIPVRTGWVFYSPLKTRIVEFPTFMQTVKWTKSVDEGHPADESISFNSKEGMEIKGDFALSYAIEASKTPDFYVKYRITDLEKFTHGQLRDIVRQSLNEVGATYAIEDIYSEKKGIFQREVEARVAAKVNPVGVSISNFGFISAPQLPGQIQTAILGKTQAITDAERSRNQLAVTQADVAKRVAEAEGNAKSTIAQAQGEAEANRLRTQSITPQILEMKRLENERARIEKWNGNVPSTIMGGNPNLLMEFPGSNK